MLQWNTRCVGRVAGKAASWLALLLTSGLWLDCGLVNWCAALHGQVQGQGPLAGIDPVDSQRSGRTLARFTALEESRVALRDRASSLVAQTPDLERELQSWLGTSWVAAGVLQSTPSVTPVPQLLETYHTYRGQSGEIYLRPELLLWYTFQDNTLVRQHLLLSLANSQRNAAQTFAAIESSRAAIEQLAADADQNFLDFRRLSDVLGRRSPLELADAEALTAGWLANDPLHAGAALVRAHALRSMGRYDECKLVLDRLDNNFPAMQSIRAAIEAQIAYQGGNRDEAKRLLEKGVALSRNSGAGESHLVYGWLYLADQKWAQAKTQASRLRALSPDDVETAILEALAVAYDRPARAREALQILRRAQLNSSPDDWHYHEALAIVHALARDRQFAKREIAQAISVAPSHVRMELQREQGEIDNGRVPTIDWHTRLAMQWRPVQ